jgi:hypothetical protein
LDHQAQMHSISEWLLSLGLAQYASVVDMRFWLEQAETARGPAYGSTP